jgi:hypothetical protein
MDSIGCHSGGRLLHNGESAETSGYLAGRENLAKALPVSASFFLNLCFSETS